MSERVNEEKHVLIIAYTHAPTLCFAKRSSGVHQHIYSNYAKQSQFVARPSWPCFHGLEAHATFSQAVTATAKKPGFVILRRGKKMENKAKFGVSSLK